MIIKISDKDKKDWEDFLKNKEKIPNKDFVNKNDTKQEKTLDILKKDKKDWDDFQKFLTGKLTQAPKVSNVKTSLNIRSNKCLPGVPFEAMA